MLEMLEVAPFHARGTLAATISLGRAVGMLCASLLTFGLGLAAPAWGWRLVPVFAIGPALLTLGLLRCVHAASIGALRGLWPPPANARPSTGCTCKHLVARALTLPHVDAAAACCSAACSWLPETASSLVLRGKVAEGRLALARVRGLLAASSEAEAEFGDILAAAELSSSRVSGPAPAATASWACISHVHVACIA